MMAPEAATVTETPALTPTNRVPTPWPERTTSTVPRTPIQSIEAEKDRYFFAKNKIEENLFLSLPKIHSKPNLQGLESSKLLVKRVRSLGIRGLTFRRACFTEL
ncbi:Hypothetical predicted protein [Octopus vulgaris]|uniref:Uncharacterized protein n=1 Tax=Octopus vulgaris TaxID=6645 RepID=A0AA36APC9_OCTVU|nr:Hypothetical predicted protein [Octopus vulgaris]